MTHRLYRVCERTAAVGRRFAGPTLQSGRAEPAGRPGAGLRGLDFAIAGRGVGDEGGEELVRRTGHLLHRPVESELVLSGRVGEAAQLAHELESGRTDFLVRSGGRE